MRTNQEETNSKVLKSCLCINSFTAKKITCIYKEKVGILNIKHYLQNNFISLSYSGYCRPAPYTHCGANVTVSSACLLPLGVAILGPGGMPHTSS